MSDAQGGWSFLPVADWTMHEGRFLAPDTLVGELGRRLVAAGAPLWRLLVSHQMLHPQLVAASVTWTREDDRTRANTVPQTVRTSDAYIGSPLQAIYERGEEVHVRPSSTGHGVLNELHAQGYCDYLGIPIEFSDATRCVMVVATKQAGGFGAHDVASFRDFTHYLAPVIETYARRQLARSLLDTYVGPRTGEKVLQGMINRGDAELIEAALWFSDLRDFTHYTETLPAAQMLRMMNEYFELVAAAVTARDGEILRFIGDAMLIVFPVHGGCTPRTACIAALDAARDAFDNLPSLNHRRRRAGAAQIRFGVGLNLGQVVYGNVGAPERLDFTVMGPAVNRAARLEALTKALDEPVLVSRAFADAAGVAARSLGTFALKGVSAPQEVLAP